jgi:tryptophanyl-tRNA synthetase
VEESYRKGELLTGVLKKMAITLLQEYVKGFQERRKDVTDEVLRQYMMPRKLEWKGNPNPSPKKMKPKESKGEKEVKQAKS